MGAGLLEANRAGGTVKRVHCGWAAHAGLAAASLAAAGITGPPTVLEGRFGFFQALCDGRVDLDVDRRRARRALGDAGHPLQALPGEPLHPRRDRRRPRPARRRRRRPRTMERIELGVAPPTLRTIAEPAELKARPPSGYAAQFSGPFTVATALAGRRRARRLPRRLHRRARPRRGTPGARRARALRRRRRRATPATRDALPGVLRVTLRSGETREHRVTENRGGPGRPLSDRRARAEVRAQRGPRAARRRGRAAARRLPRPRLADLTRSTHELLGGCVTRYDTVVLGGTVVFPGDGPIRCDIGIRDGRIAAIADDLEATAGRRRRRRARAARLPGRRRQPPALRDLPRRSRRTSRARPSPRSSAARRRRSATSAPATTT